MSMQAIDDLSGLLQRVNASDGNLRIANFIWDTDTLSWVKQSQGSAGGPSSDVSVISTVGITNSQLRAAPIETTNPSKASRVDDQGTIIYIGYALPGVVDGGSTWAIKRVQTVGEELRTEWANGVSTYTHSWSLRTGYTYS